MNILFASGRSVFSGKPIGGAETSMSVMAEVLAQKGHQVIYFSTGNSYIPVKKMEVGMIYFLFKPFPLPFLSSNLKKKWHQKQMEFILRKLIKKNNIQLAYCFGKAVHPVQSVKQKYFNNLKIMLRVAGITQTDEIKTYSDAEINKNVAFLNAIDCLNYQSETHYRTYTETREKMGFKLPTGKVFIHDIGIHPSFFKPSPSTLKIKHILTFGVIMRFSARKRQDLVIEALVQLKHLPVKVIFIGDGPNRLVCEQKAKSLGVFDKCRFMGFMSRDKLMTEYLEIDVLLHPVDYEPQSKAVWEAMALGIPVLASNVPSLNNIIMDNLNGFLVDNYSSDWTNKLIEILKNRKMLSQISREAAVYVKKVADPGINADIFEDYFNKLIYKS